MMDSEKRALERLLDIAARDTGQSRRVADFLLAWSNAGQCGSYNLTTAWGVNDMCVVFRLASRANSYPDTFGYARSSKRSCVRGGRSW